MITLTTHYVDYTPQNMGTDYVVTACGKLIHVTYFSVKPTCRDPRCVAGAAKRRILIARDATVPY